MKKINITSKNLLLIGLFIIQIICIYISAAFALEGTPYLCCDITGTLGYLIFACIIEKFKRTIIING